MTTYLFPVASNEFQGKRVLVTGGTKGIGEAIVRILNRFSPFVVNLPPVNLLQAKVDSIPIA